MPKRPKVRLTEPEINIVCQFAGTPCRLRGSTQYGQLVAGREIMLRTEVNDQQPKSETFRLRLLAVAAGKTALQGVKGHPPSKLFEGTVLESPQPKNVEAGQEVFGIVFPNGFVSLVDSGPTEEYTDRRIRAAIAYFGS